MVFDKNSPVHVAIIPDGNRRWAKGNGLKVARGYDKAGNNLKELIRSANELGVKYLSLWIFSTDNWKRSKQEINGLFELFMKNSGEFKEELVNNKIRFRHLGRKDRLPSDVLRSLKDLEISTKEFGEYNIQFCFDYGGRDEIVRAVNKILKDGKKKISEEEFGRYLDSFEIPNPDLVIRTSGEKRTSGFMPFQSAYSELYFSDVHFPDFGQSELKEAIEDFKRRKRNFGK